MSGKTSWTKGELGGNKVYLPAKDVKKDVNSILGQAIHIFKQGNRWLVRKGRGKNPKVLGSAKSFTEARNEAQNLLQKEKEKRE